MPDLCQVYIQNLLDRFHALEDAAQSSETTVEDLKRLIFHFARESRDEGHYLQTTFQQLSQEISKIEEQLEIENESIAILDTLAENLQLAKHELEQQNRQLAFEADHDALTGLYNRRFVLETINREVNRSMRSGLPLCLVMSDLDHFKAVNDRYGHPAGDKVLKTVAQTMHNCVRAYDTVARYGGEEFLIVLVGEPAQRCIPVVNRIQEAIRKMAIECDSNTIHVTASFGIAEYIPSENEIDLETLIARSDRALYQAKQNGRDCYVIWDESLQHTLLRKIAPSR